MNTYHVIDKDSWPRRELFDFYQKFADPCFNISASLNAKNIHQYANDNDQSFFLLTLYAILRAANSIPQTRQRILDGNIIEFDKIDTLTPIMTPNELFRQVWCDYTPTLTQFIQETTPKIEAAKLGTPGPMQNHGDDYMCASCLPWLHFTSVTQATYLPGQAVPILAWGKMQNNLIPISCKFSHSFVDGLHVSRFFTSIQESFENPESLQTPLPE